MAMSGRGQKKGWSEIITRGVLISMPPAGALMKVLMASMHVQPPWPHSSQSGKSSTDIECCKMIVLLQENMFSKSAGAFGRWRSRAGE
jgi:hypothetical protein